MVFLNIFLIIKENQIIELNKKEDENLIKSSILQNSLV
jgi:hypothetical protein